uniref:Cyclin-dependent kinase 2-associated protein 2 n=1 Tax=Caligus rogercresseyi TaxID=217165 RepID=C1BR87_CALRO|nr:Cyclin-dependent kinase 2-associated protein 2 [Caligus rogercresseyi]
MSFSNLNLEEIQMLIAANAANAANAAAQLQQQQQAQAQKAPRSPSVGRPPSNGVPPSLSSTSSSSPAANAGSGGALDPQSQSKYHQLLSVIEEMSKDIRPTYAGSKSSAERLKRGIIFARILVRECLVETERSSRA